MTLRLLITASLYLALAGCSGSGGGATTPTTPAAPWGKFRHDLANTGAAGGPVATVSNAATRKIIFFPATPDGLPTGISGSPVVGIDHTIYFATEGTPGELYALNQDLTLKWGPLTQCALPDKTVAFGPIRSTPALTSVRTDVSLTGQNDKVLYFGDDNGNFFAVQDRGDGLDCLWVFTPPGEPAPITSSPTFLVDTVEQVITGVYFGSTNGVFYALNQDGTLKWQFPPTGDLGAITSSPAVDLYGTLYFTAADGNLYALNADGTERFPPFHLGTVSSPASRGFLASSPASSTGSVYVGTEDGAIFAVNLDGSKKWSFAPQIGEPGYQSPVVASVAIGETSYAVFPTPTAAPPTSPTSGVSTPTPTATPGAQLHTLIFGITTNGTVYPLDDLNLGRPASGIAVAGVTPTPGTDFVSSPAFSSDGCLVFGDGAGNLHIRRVQPLPSGTTPTPTIGKVCVDADFPVNTSDTFPGNSAELVVLNSSPAIDTIGTDGVIYICGDDGQGHHGRLYAIVP